MKQALCLRRQSGSRLDIHYYVKEAQEVICNVSQKVERTSQKFALFVSWGLFPYVKLAFIWTFLNLRADFAELLAHLRRTLGLSSQGLGLGFAVKHLASLIWSSHWPRTLTAKSIKQQAGRMKWYLEPEITSQNFREAIHPLFSPTGLPLIKAQ